MIKTKQFFLLFTFFCLVNCFIAGVEKTPANHNYVEERVESNDGTYTIIQKQGDTEIVIEGQNPSVWEKTKKSAAYFAASFFLSCLSATMPEIDKFLFGDDKRYLDTKVKQNIAAMCSSLLMLVASYYGGSTLLNHDERIAKWQRRAIVGGGIIMPVAFALALRKPQN